MTEVACEWVKTVEPAEEPISLDEAKLHCSIVQEDDNVLIDAYRIAARQAAENYLGRALFTQTWQLQLSDFADVIYLPMTAPLQNNAAATPSTAPIVQYYDADGTLQTLASSAYTVDTVSDPCRLVRAPNQSWPTTQSDRLVTVIITYVCGWTAVDLIPELIKQGMRLSIAAADADRLGGEGNASQLAAEACWHAYGRSYWREPQACLS